MEKVVIIAGAAAASAVLAFVCFGKKKVAIPKKIRIEYFDIEGTADKCRIALKLAGIPFEDVRFSFGDWREMKNKTPQRLAPVLYIDDEPPMCQSYALARYVGRLAGLYPEDPLEALKVDQVCDLECDERNELRNSILFAMDPTRCGHPTDLTPDKKKEIIQVMRRSFADEKTDRGVHNYWRLYEGILERNGTGWFVGDKMTMADLTVLGTVRWLESGILDGIPTDSMAQYPWLVAHYKRMMSHPVIKKHFDSKAKKS